MNSIQVTVTQEDIILGTKSDAFCCPVARAISRVTNKEASVVDGSVALNKEQRASNFRYPLPKEVAAWYFKYDVGGVMKPISFILEMDKVVKPISNWERTWHEVEESLAWVFYDYNVNANRETGLVIITNKNNNRQVLGNLEGDNRNYKLTLPADWKERLTGEGEKE